MSDTSRSATLLQAGLHAVERGDLDGADEYLVQLEREGAEIDYRRLVEAMLAQAR